MHLLYDTVRPLLEPANRNCFNATRKVHVTLAGISFNVFPSNFTASIFLCRLTQLDYSIKSQEVWLHWMVSGISFFASEDIQTRLGTFGVWGKCCKRGDFAVCGGTERIFCDRRNMEEGGGGGCRESGNSFLVTRPSQGSRVFSGFYLFILYKYEYTMVSFINVRAGYNCFQIQLNVININENASVS